MRKQIDVDIDKFKDFYNTHSTEDTRKEFGLSKKKIADVLTANSIQRHSTIENRRLSCLNRFGVDNPSKADFVKEKKSSTCMEHFGVPCNLSSKESREKASDTKERLYGNRNYNNQEKMVRTSLLMYGTEHPAQSDSVKDKTRTTNIERYGENYKQIFVDRMVESSIEKYGSMDACYEISAKKVKETNLKRYGVTCSVHNPEIQEKVKQTNLIRYGSECYLSSDVAKANRPIWESRRAERCRETCLERYGVEYSSQSEEVKKKISDTVLNKYGVECFCLTDGFRKYSSNSKPNLKFSNLLDSFGLSYVREFVIGRKAYDFKVANVLVEINPTATHNSTWSPFRCGGMDMNYHMSKSMLAEENGYRCIHVWDWDDWNKIAIELSSSLDVVDSRSCEVREIGIRDCNEFMENNHIDGSCRGDVCIGILFCGNIVSAMMFSRTKYSRDFELLRYCSSKHVDCGGELMLNLFKSKYEFDSIIVRCDRSKQNCNLYTDLGFELYSDAVAPNRHWYNMKTKMHIMDNDITDDVLRRLIGVNRDLQTIDAKTEDIMVNLGFVDVYDCGTSVYIIK